jgi:hypothetical protein
MEIKDFYEEITPKLTEQHSFFVQLSLRSFIHDPSSEASDILNEYWNDPEKKETMMVALWGAFHTTTQTALGGTTSYSSGVSYAGARINSQTTQPVVGFWNQMDRDMENLRLPGYYYDLVDKWGVSTGPPYINPAVIAMFHDMTDIKDMPLCLGFIDSVSQSHSYIPGAAELVEQWSQWEVSDTGDYYFSNLLRERATEALDAIRMRERIRTQSRELLLKLAAGEITPDDLLPTPVPWVWENGKYVQR